MTRPTWRTAGHAGVVLGGAAGLAVVGRAAAGPTFGGLIWLAWALPVLACWSGRQGLSVGWQTGQVAAGTALAVLVSGISGLIGQETRTVLVLGTLAWVGLLAGRSGGAGLFPLLWTGWLTLPIWLGGPGASVAGLLGIHPVSALNAVWPELGDWTHQAVAYRWLTRLGQDLGYTLPASVWPCVVVHGGLGAGLLLGRAVRRSRAGTPDGPGNVPRGTIGPTDG